MLKYERMIKRLSIAEKIGILTDISALEDDNIARLGIPVLDVLYLRHMMRGKCPIPAALAHSWDRELIRDVAGSVCNGLESDTSALVVTPGAKVKLSPYRNEMSEDPYLASELASEFAAGVKSTGVASVISGYYLTDTDAEMMDKKPSERVINEFVIKPYKDTLIRSGADAVMTDVRTLSGSYSAVNAGLRRELFEDERLTVCDRVEADDTVKFIVDGGICLNGSAVALEAALNRYKKLKKSQDSGDLTAGEVETEISEGRAISPEIIDSSVDRIIDLAFASRRNKEHVIKDIDDELYYAPDEETAKERKKRNRRELREKIKSKATAILSRLKGNYSDSSADDVSVDEAIEKTVTPEDKLLRRAAAESVVLLRNVKNVAPIRKGASVAIIGGIADEYNDGNGTLAQRCERLLYDAGISNVIRARGYDFNADRIDRESEITDVISAAGRSSVVLLFLGHGEGRGKDIPKTHKLSLPANQLVLAERLAKFGARVIAVLESGYGMDVGFTELFAGAITAPFGCPYDAEAIVNVLLGRINPSGRLSYTLYSSFDTYAPKHTVYRDEWNVKSGPFVGYRYYDTAKLKVGYPFGHGLSYAEVVYSNLTVRGNSVTFSLTNKSNMRVKEVAQIYIGAKTSSVIRPKKELCGFEMVELGPKETKTVTVKAELPKTFDVEKGRFVEEKCTYEIFVGPSSQDERLVASYYGGNSNLTADKQLLVDYVQSKSNIIIDKYTLEANYKIMKKSAKNIVSGIASILLAVSLGIYNSLEPSGPFIPIIAGIIAVAGIFFFVAEIRERNRGYKEERVIIDKANRDRFKDAVELPEFSAQRMFQDEFDVIDKDSIIKESIFREDGSVDESLKYIDKDLDFAKASRELSAFASDRGIKLGEGEAEKIFAAFAASRIIIFKGMRSDIFRSLVAVLCEYFETNPYIDTVDSTYVNEESALFGASGDNSRIKKNLAYAIEAASNVKFNVHIAALDGVRGESMLNYFTPYAKYAKNPLGYTAISAHNEWDKETTYYIPQNMWFCINLAEYEGYDDIPDYIVETASVNVISPSKCKVSNSHMMISKFRYYQFDYLSERSAGAYGIPEDSWKKIDKLAVYASNYSSFRIENKLCLSFERYASALMAAGIEGPQAVDSSMAAKLLPSIVIATLGRIPDEDRSLEETIDAIFGSDILDECHVLLEDVADSSGRKKNTVITAVNDDDDEDEVVENENETDVEIVNDDTSVED